MRTLGEAFAASRGSMTPGVQHAGDARLDREIRRTRGRRCEVAEYVGAGRLYRSQAERACFAADATGFLMKPTCSSASIRGPSAGQSRYHALIPGYESWTPEIWMDEFLRFWSIHVYCSHPMDKPVSPLRSRAAGPAAAGVWPRPAGRFAVHLGDGNGLAELVLRAREIWRRPAQTSSSASPCASSCMRRSAPRSRMLRALTTPWRERSSDSASAQDGRQHPDRSLELRPAGRRSHRGRAWAWRGGDIGRRGR